MCCTGTLYTFSYTVSTNRRAGCGALALGSRQKAEAAARNAEEVVRSAAAESEHVLALIESQMRLVRQQCAEKVDKTEKSAERHRAKHKVGLRTRGSDCSRQGLTTIR